MNYEIFKLWKAVIINNCPSQWVRFEEKPIGGRDLRKIEQLALHYMNHPNLKEVANG